LLSRPPLFGDPALVQLAADHPHLRETATVDPPAGVLDWLSRAASLLGLLGLVVAGDGIREEHSRV
jgi:hypothetical protein